MKVELFTATEEQIEERDYRDCMEIKIDGKMEFSFWDGEPEDANLCRDFGDVYGITNALEKAFNAGKNGETFELIKKDMEL